MRASSLGIFVYLILVLNNFFSSAAKSDEVSNTEKSKETLAEKLFREKSDTTVVISVEDRDGSQRGIGTGFFIDKSGLIVTNLHVIGQSRKISVLTSNGKSIKVESIFASDATLDLAVLKVDHLPKNVLQLGNSSQAKQGQPVVVIGNPQGLKHSIVSGIVSGQREIDSKKMLQLAIPIEPGNSGGPVLNRNGEVIGIVTMKSAITENLGFAVTIDQLKPLLSRPNTVPMSRWLTIGSLNTQTWETKFGATWRSRAGKITVSGIGSGFGGRSLCLCRETFDEAPYELSVKVQINENDGAAGLIFLSNGDQNHYGFYPSSGTIRITQFNGPSVYDWRVLKEIPVKNFKMKDWNHLKVRIEKNRFLCFVNEQLVYSSQYDQEEFSSSGQFGFAKFRHTSAVFKEFEYQAEIQSKALDPDVVSEIQSLVDQLPELKSQSQDNLVTLSGENKLTNKLMQQKISKLQQQIEELKKTQASIRTEATLAQLKKFLDQDDSKIDLFTAAILLAQLDDHELPVAPYQEQLNAFAQEIEKGFTKTTTKQQKLDQLLQYLFEENGFHGSRFEYYHRANSYLSRVIEDREGLPITLSVLVIALGEKLGLNIQGVGLPGHFIIRHEPAKGESQLVDVFDQGKKISTQQAKEIVASHAGIAMTKEHLQSVSKRAILERIVVNLLGIAQNEKDFPAMLRYYQALVTIKPESSQYRGMVALLLHEQGFTTRAMAQLEILERDHAAEVGQAKLQQLRSFFESR